ncbi:MAG: hypothetical protein V1706_14040 [Pseudomonadota bacterium]
MKNEDKYKIIKATNVVTVWASLPLIAFLVILYVFIGVNSPAADTSPKSYQLVTLLLNVCAGLIPVFILFIGNYLVLQKIQELKQEGEKDLLLENIDQNFQKAISSGVLREELSNVVKENTFKVLEEINEKDRMFAPEKTYYNQSKDLLLRQKKEFGSTSTYSFMSTSGVNFLNNAVSDIKDSVSLVIKLLLMNPGVEKNIEARYEQLKNYENKSTIILKEEIINSIYKAILICKNKTKLTIHICLHDEAPLFRFEFTDKEAYLSYYLSQESDKNIGPVGVYKQNSIVFNAYKEYFNDVWKRSEEKYCLLIDKNKSVVDIRNFLLETFKSYDNGIQEIIKNRCQEYCIIEESRRCQNNCPK